MDSFSWITAWASRILSPSLPDHCEPSSEFLVSISSRFNTCIPTPLAFLSLSFGVLSLITWLFSQIPQVYENYKLKSASGLSLLFLLDWGIGDTANVLGAVLTNQASWQLYLAVYFLIIDLLLLWQYFWYQRPQILGAKSEMIDTPASPPGHGPQIIDGMTKKGLPVHDDSREFLLVEDTMPTQAQRPSSRSRSRPRVTWGNRSPGPSPQTILFLSTLCAVLVQAAPTGYSGLSLSSSSASSTTQSDDNDSRKLDNETIGLMFSWLCTSCYLVSRLPQMYKNWRRKSTAGLSCALFICAICGNLLYAASLLTNPSAYSDLPPYGGGGWAGPSGNDRMKWISLAFPFFLGTAGDLVLDTAVLFQFMLYRKSTGADDDDDNDDELVCDEPVEMTAKSKPTQGQGLWARLKDSFSSVRKEECPELAGGATENLNNPDLQSRGYGTIRLS